LTTAQYLTPGDLSIQGVGVTPDVDLVRLRVDKTGDETDIQLQRSSRRRQESDYEWHLDHPSAMKGGKPAEVISYLYVPPPGQQRRPDPEDETEEEAQAEEEEAEDQEALEENYIDFPMEFARDLLANTKASRRKEMISGGKTFFDKVRAEEDKKLGAALEKLGVDWSQGPPNPPAGQVQVTLSTPGSDGKVAAGNKVKLRGTVKNVGTTPVHRVHALLKSDTFFDENEMVFGKIAPGDSKSFDLTMKVAKGTLSRTDLIRAAVFAQGGLRANNAELTLNLVGKQRPLFAYAYQTLDDVKGNQDGRVQIGEKVRLLVKVKNIGPGAALKTEAILRNGPGQQGILISAGRFEAKDLAPGATKSFSFVYDVGTEFRGEDYQLELMVGDSVLGESVTDKIKIKVATSTTAIESASGTATVASKEAILREAAGTDALILGKSASGTGFKVTGKAGAFTRVELEAGRPAFVATSDLRSGGTPKPAIATAWQVTPPVLAVNAPTVVNGSSVSLKGLVTDDYMIKDLFIRVYNRDSKMPAKKVFYLPNRGDKTRLPFQTDVPLWPGSNIIQIFARETNEVQSVATVIVLSKQGPSVAQDLRAPKGAAGGSAAGTKPAVPVGQSATTVR
jgi:carboxyl-terminal processing protease